MSADPGGRPPGARRGRRSRLLVAVGAVALAALLAGCSSSPSAASHGSATHHKSTTSTTKGASPSTSTTTSTTAPSTTSTTAAPVSTSTLCQPAELRLAVSGQTGAAGTLTTTVGLTNVSSATCTMEGYPGMQLLSASGAPIPTTVVRGQANFPSSAADAAPALISLTPGASAKFSIQYSDVPVGGETSCPGSATAEVTPPTDTTSAVMTLKIAPCDNGTVHVSPVYT